MNTKPINKRLLKSLALTALMLLSASTTWAANYEIKIGGTQVTDDNKADLSVIDGVTGTVTYDSDVNTLTLTNATITCADPTYGSLYANLEGLTIVVNGKCEIESDGTALNIRKNTTLSGYGSLSINGACAIYIYNNTLTMDGPYVTAKGTSTTEAAVRGRKASTSYYGSLAINSGSLKAYGEMACISALKELTLGEGTTITAPTGAKFNTTNHAVQVGTTTVKQQWVVIEGPMSEAEKLGTPLTLEAIEDGTVTVDNERKLTIGYAVNGGDITWGGGATIEIPLTAGQQVSFYGDNASYATGSLATIIQCSADCYVYGNIMSLLNSTGFKDLKELTGSYCFKRLFFRNTHIKNHASKQLSLPATTLTWACYEYLFYECTGLTTAPALPATTLATGCYNGMFRFCTNLVTPPELPAMTMERTCYYQMFYGCKSLTTAPALPATTLADECYNSMFYGCTSLTTAPDLPANTLTESCYYEMFKGCTKLNSVKSLATDISANTCTTRWLESVSATGTFEKAAGYTGWPTGASGIPEGWTVTEDTSKQPCGLAFTPTELNVTYGDEVVEPTLTNDDGLPVTYTSSKPAVATVADDGKLTILTAGTTVITASFEGDATHYPGSASYTLTVTSKGDAPELAFDREAMAVTKDKGFTAPKLTIPDGLTATYSSSNNSVVAVNATTGALTINGVGTATITVTTPATLQYASGSAVYYIMVLKNAEKFRCDANNDGSVSITDAVTVVNQILSGEAAAAPASDMPQEQEPMVDPE